MRKIVLAAALVSGCSWSLQGKPRADKSCSTSHVPWIVDAAAVAASVAAVGYGLVKQTDATMVVGGAGALGGVLFTGSAVSGYRWRRECVSRE